MLSHTDYVLYSKHLQPSSEDTSFNIGANNVARNIKVDPNELPLQEIKHTHEEAKLRLNTLKWVKTSDRTPGMTQGLPDDMRYLPAAHLQCFSHHTAGDHCQLQCLLFTTEKEHRQTA